MSSSPKPTYRKPSHSRRNILLGVLAIVVVAAGGTGYYFWKKSTTKVTAQSSVLQTATVTKGNIKLFASGTGTLVSPSEATFGFKTTGQVAEVLVKTGDVVEAGQLLAKLDTTDAQESYQQAVNALKELTSPSALATAQEDVAADEVNVANYKSTLAYLVTPDVVYWTEEVEKAEKALTDAQAAAAANPSADATLAVQKAQTTLNGDKYALAEATLNYWNDYVPATFLTVITKGRTTTKMVIPPTTAQVDKAWADYRQAKQSLVDDRNYLTAITTGTIPGGATGTKITALQTAQQAVATAKTALDETNLYSPIHGTVLTVGISAGDTAGSSSTITVANLDQPYTLEIYLDQSDWGNIQVGYPVQVTFDLLSGSVYTGKVISVDPQLSSTNGNLYVHAHVRLDTTVKTTLPFGTSASVDVIGGQATNVLLVPLEALHKIGTDQYSVFVMVDGKPVVRMVEVGLQDATHAEIKSGLNAGDVVTTGITVTK